MWRQRRNKYGNIKQNGYDSKLESFNASWLHGLVRTKKIKQVEEQVSVRLILYNQDGTKSHNFGRHIVDFRVTLNDGRQKWVEAKGFPTQTWKQFKMPMTELISDIPYLVNPSEKELLA